MSAHHYFRDGNGDVQELTPYIDRTRWSLMERAEEGQPGSTTLIVVDTSMALEIDGHRNFWAIEDESEDTNDELMGGVILGQEIARRVGTDLEPAARVWAVEVYDKNTVWNRRLMTGSDCKRPAETDVERVTWLFSTAETGIFDDTTTYVSAANTVNMDKDDYRRRYRDQVIDDCAQDSGKNWWCSEHETGTGREIMVWYGRDSVAAYDSPLYLSNDPADWLDAELADGTSLVWPIADGDGTKLGRDPSRQYSGVLLEWRRGWIYRKNPAMTFRRDFLHRAKNIKTKARAIARALRLLAKLDTQDEVVRTSVILPKGKATMLRAGMRVPFKATHLPDRTSWGWMRVLSCLIGPEPGGNGERYKLDLELSPTGQTASPPLHPSAACSLIGASSTAAGTYEGNHSATTQAPGNLFYLRAGISHPEVPTIGFVGSWNFPDYPNDAAGDSVGNFARVVVAGAGTLTISVSNYGAVDHTFRTDGPDGEARTGLAVGSHVFTIPDDEHCYHWVDITDTSGAGSKWVFDGWTWEPTTS